MLVEGWQPKASFYSHYLSIRAMAMTKFAMVEELASLIKDNLFSKHVVLSTEETLIDFLQNDTSLDGVVELPPMSPYHRLLLHRLADIYGFAHESVGEGDDRHLVLERCPEATIPPILVSDIIWQYDDQSPISSRHILRREEAPAFHVRQTSSASMPFEEREAAYITARERIFSLHDGDDKEDIAPKSRKVPVVARRMIAHALGQKILPNSDDKKPSYEQSDEKTLTDSKCNDEENGQHSTCEANKNIPILPQTKNESHERKKNYKVSGKSTSLSGDSNKAISCSAGQSTSNSISLLTENNGRVVGVEKLEREHVGAAKRIFAHALGLPSSKFSNGLVKPAGSDSRISRELGNAR